MTTGFLGIAHHISSLPPTHEKLTAGNRIIGQVAGVAAKLALDAGVAVQDVDTGKLREILAKQGAVFEYHPAPRPVRR